MAKTTVSRAMKLCGTEEKAGPLRALNAGNISAVLDNGSLRYIRYRGVEVLRAISFLVRDKNWATYKAEIAQLSVKQTNDGFTVSYRAVCKDDIQAIEYNARIEAVGDMVKFHAMGLPKTDFQTNRTGFVVLHPLECVVGQSVEIGHVDGTKEKAKFPKIISPGQPVFGIRSLKHVVMEGVTATVLMEGNKFEMEDHRNWMDASYKTYVCSLLDPWPYVLPKGQSFEQSITLELEGKKSRQKCRKEPSAVSIGLGRSLGKMPQLGAAVRVEHIEAAIKSSELIRKLRLSNFVCQIDGRAIGNAEAAAGFADLSRHCTVPVKLEIILPAVESADVETAAIAKVVRASGLRPKSIVVTQAHDLKSFQPGAPRPWGPSYDEMANAVRAEFPGTKVGGGMLSYFTELNRKPVPAGLFDFVTHTLCPIVHAADDISVMETLESLPWIMASTRNMIGKQSYHIGPSGISCRDNPYGTAMTPNPNRSRLCLSNNDPRQEGLFAMAWNVGLMAAAAKGRIDEIALGSVIGAQGAINVKGVLPIYHILRGMGEAVGSSQVIIANSEPRKVAALAHDSRRGRVLWIANLTAESQVAKINGFPGPANLTFLDEKNFGFLRSDADLLSHDAKYLKKISQVELSAYSVAVIKAP